MTKPGHEAPLFDNANKADITPHADEAQLRIGQELPETPRAVSLNVAPKEPKLIPVLELPEKEQAGVDRLVDQDFVDGNTALFYRTSASKARRIIAHGYSSQAAESAQQASEQRAAEEQVKQSEHLEESLQLLRETDPHKPQSGEAA